MILSTSAFGNNILQFLTVVIIFVLVLGITFYTTRWIGNYQKKSFAQKNLEVCEVIRVGTNKMMMVVRAGADRYLVVGVGKDEMTLLAELDPGELLEYTRDTAVKGAGAKGMSFSAAIKGMLDKNKVDGDPVEANDEGSSEEIKDDASK